MWVWPNIQKKWLGAWSLTQPNKQIALKTNKPNLKARYDTASLKPTVRDRAPGPFYRMLGQTHVNGWSRVIASQNRGSTSYIFPFSLKVLQWSRHLFNYWDK